MGWGPIAVPRVAAGRRRRQSFEAASVRQNTSDEMPRRGAEAVLVTARRRVLAAPQAYIEVAAVADAARPTEGLRRERRGEPPAHGQLLDARLEGVRAVGRREASFGLERDLELACAELARITTLGTNPLEVGAPKRAGAVFTIHRSHVDADRGHLLGDGVGEVCLC